MLHDSQRAMRGGGRGLWSSLCQRKTVKEPSEAVF